MPSPALPAWPQPTFPGSSPATFNTAPTPPGSTSEQANRPSFPARDWRSTLVPAEPGKGGPNAGPVNGASAQYHEWARAQRPGAVYSGGHELPPPTTRLTGLMDQSGSLTGHILAQGQQDTPTPRSRTVKVVVIMLVVMTVLVAAGAAAATFAGDTVDAIFDNLLKS